MNVDVDSDIVAVFPWTGLNDLFMWSNNENIAMGGGGEGFGFVLDCDFLTGSTTTCETFANPPLVNADGETFNIKNVEVWGFPTGLQRRGAHPSMNPNTTLWKDSNKISMI